MQRRVKLLTPHGPETWKVLLRRLSSNQHERVHGLCHWSKKTIDLDSKQDLLELIAAAIHEAAHVALGEDYNEPPIERIEHNALVLIAPFIREALED